MKILFDSELSVRQQLLRSLGLVHFCGVASLVVVVISVAAIIAGFGSGQSGVAYSKAESSLSRVVVRANLLESCVAVAAAVEQNIEVVALSGAVALAQQVAVGMLGGESGAGVEVVDLGGATVGKAEAVEGKRETRKRHSWERRAQKTSAMPAPLTSVVPFAATNWSPALSNAVVPSAWLSSSSSSSLSSLEMLMLRNASFPDFLFDASAADCAALSNATNGIFVGSAATLACPQLLTGAAAVAPLERFESSPSLAAVNGSSYVSSVYYFDAPSSSVAGGVVASPRNVSAALSLLQREPGASAATVALAASAAVDDSMRNFYFRGTNTTVLLYASIALPRLTGISGGGSSSGSGGGGAASNAGYVAVHRTFPGILRNSTTYDPTLRNWFIAAPEDGIGLTGPYVETFSRRQSINLSSRKTITNSALTGSGSFRTATVVGAAVMAIDDLQKEIASIKFLESGYAILVKADSTVVAYGADASLELYDSDTETFKLLAEVEPDLASFTSSIASLTKGSQSFDRASTGETWTCAYVPLFNAGSPATPSLVLLMLGKQSEALTTLPALADATSSTSSQLALIVCVGAAVAATISLTLLALLFPRITAPLELVARRSQAIINISADEVRDFRSAMDDFPDLPTAGTELSDLVAGFRAMGEALVAMEHRKQTTPKYPNNPFFGASDFFWRSRNSDLAGAGGATAMIGNLAIRVPSIAVPLETEIGAARQRSNSNNFPAPVRAATHGVLASFCRAIQSFATKLRALGFFFLLMITIIAAVCIATLRTQSYEWMTETGEFALVAQQEQLQRVASAKADFTFWFLQQQSVDLQNGALYFAAVMDGNVTLRDQWSYSQVPSYSLDPNNFYRAPVDSSADYSGYFLAADANCGTASACRAGRISAETNITSLLDFKLVPLLYPQSVVSFAQTGMEATGQTRIAPYLLRATYSQPTSCPVEVTTTHASCAAGFSQCNSGNYPAYDPRCRSWYSSSYLGGDPDATYFEYPRTSSTGSTVVTVSTPIRSGSSLQGAMYGVLAFNVLADDLANSVNSFAVLDNGYAFVVDSLHPEQVLLHPDLPSGCSQVQCAEPDFSSSEYAAFNATVLSRLRDPSLGATEPTFRKGGKVWYQASAPVVVNGGRQSYSLLVVVPKDDVIRAKLEVEDAINEAVIGAIVALAVLLAVGVVALRVILNRTVEGVVQPIVDLVNVCHAVVDGDLQATIPTEASSTDMQVLLQAFGGMIVALRFGSEAFVHGNLTQARAAFEDALRLYTTIHHTRGIGVAHNNLGAVEMGSGNFAFARDTHFRPSVELARQTLAALPATATPQDRRRASIALSDRIGNLATCLTEMKEFAAAFELLEEAQELDRTVGNTRGWVAKQLALGRWYMLQNEERDALRTFENTLRFLGSTAEDAMSSTWNMEDIPAAQQSTLLQIAEFYRNKGDMEGARAALVRCITTTKTMNQRVMVKALSLLAVVLRATSAAEAQALVQLGQAHGFPELSSTAAAPVANSHKRVTFLLDYSGSMAGSKIRAAVENLEQIIDRYMAEDDELSLWHFSSSVQVDFSLWQKKDAAQQMRSAVRALMRPSGGTAFFDALHAAATALQEQQPRKASGAVTTWLVALTDGDDNGSRQHTVESVVSALRRGLGGVTGLIVIAVGEDVVREPLQRLAAATSKGILLETSADAKGISEAFAQVASIITAEVTLEDF